MNIIILWTTIYINAALDQLAGEGYPIQPEDVARLSPLVFEHINLLGRYAFSVPDSVIDPQHPFSRRILEEGVRIMASLDWSQCPVVESIPGKVSGAWVFRGTRVPVAAIFENLKNSSIEEVLENFHVTREQVQTVLDFAAKSTMKTLRVG